MGCLIYNFALFDPISQKLFVALFGVPTVTLKMTQWVAMKAEKSRTERVLVRDHPA